MSDPQSSTPNLITLLIIIYNRGSDKNTPFQICSYPGDLPYLKVSHQTDEDASLSEPGSRQAASPAAGEISSTLERVMYVATDLDHWVTDAPHIWGGTVTINGKEFALLTQVVVAWFKERISRAEAACAAGKLSVDSLGKIVKAFCPVYEFAVRAKMIPEPIALRKCQQKEEKI